MKTAITIWAMKGGDDGSRDLLDAAFASKQAGFDALEVSYNETGLLSPRTSREEITKTEKALQKNNLTLSSMSTLLFNKYNLVSNQIEERKYARMIVQKMLETAHDLNIPSVSISPGKVTSEVRYLEAYHRFCEEIPDLLLLAKSLNVILCIENVWQKFLLSPLEFRSILEKFSALGLKACLDIGNTTRDGYPEDWIENLSVYIEKIHVTDTRVRMNKFVEFVNPGTGNIHWNEVMALLSQTGYNGYLSVEAFYSKSEDEQLRLCRIASFLKNLING